MSSWMRGKRVLGAGALVLAMWNFGLVANVGVAQASPSVPESSASAAASISPQIAVSFPGFSEPTTSPPDTTVAASPSEVMEVVNTNYVITSRKPQPKPSHR